MVVALGVDRPLALADQVAGVGGVDAQVGFGVVLDAHRGVGDVLGGYGPRSSPVVAAPLQGDTPPSG